MSLATAAIANPVLFNLQLFDRQVAALQQKDVAFWSAFREVLAPAAVLPAGYRGAAEGTLLSAAALADGSKADRARAYAVCRLINSRELAFVLKYPHDLVLEQLLAAHEAGFLSLYFALPCETCGCEVQLHDSVERLVESCSDRRCPLCDDPCQFARLDQVCVFFQFKASAAFPSVISRCCFSSVAQRHLLESYFTVSKMHFSFDTDLPKGKYLLHFMEADVRIYLNVHRDAIGAPPPITTSGDDERDSGDYEERVAQNRCHVVLPLGALSGAEPETLDATHGSIRFALYNDTPFTGYLRLFIAFDMRIECCAEAAPAYLTAPMLLHHLRGDVSVISRCLPLSKSLLPIGQSCVCATFAVRTPVGFHAKTTAAVDDVSAVVRKVCDTHHGFVCGELLAMGIYQATFLNVTSATVAAVCIAQLLGAQFGVHLHGAVVEGPASFSVVRLAGGAQTLTVVGDAVTASFAQCQQDSGSGQRQHVIRVSSIGSDGVCHAFGNVGGDRVVNGMLGYFSSKLRARIEDCDRWTLIDLPPTVDKMNNVSALLHPSTYTAPEEAASFFSLASLRDVC